MAQISYLVRHAVHSRMADVDSGFNFWFDTFCKAPPYNLIPTPFQIDFGEESTNFRQSNVTASQLDGATATPDGTLCRLYTVRSSNMTGTVQKFTLFSGTVQIGVDFDVAWPSTFDATDTESVADAIEDAMVKVFNSSKYYGMWTGGVIYNGEISHTRGLLREEGAGARQTLAFTLNFELQV